MFGLNPYARVRTDREARRLAKETGASPSIVRLLLTHWRVCDACGPDDYESG
jgi:hypothetical protein